MGVADAALESLLEAVDARGVDGALVQYASVCLDALSLLVYLDLEVVLLINRLLIIKLR